MSTRDTSDQTENTTTGTTEPAVSCGDHRAAAQAFRLIGDMWTLFIVSNLSSGRRRFGELREALGNVSPKTVSQRLKMLEEMGLVERHAFAEIPPRVEYCLTEKGQALMDVIEAIERFGERYLSDNSATAAEATVSCTSPADSPCALPEPIS